MKINGVGGADGPGLVDRIMEGERAPVEAAKGRLSRVVEEKNEYTAFSGLLGSLGQVASGLSRPSGFTRMAVDSSHPDILDGLVDGAASPGTYELEVRGLALHDKHLDVGFPDADKTPVGFGFLAVEADDGGEAEIVIEPGSTLNDVATRINDAHAGVRASVINTGFAEDPFRLLVASEATGEAARLRLDADTTFLDFGNIKTGRNLDVRFEDVEVTRPDNKLHDLLAGVKLDAKRAEPGTRVTVNVRHDVDKTAAGVREFAEKYNEIARYANQQYQIDPATGRGGKLAGDGDLRSVMRNLQGEIGVARGVGPVKSLAEVGITTNAKTGELEIDETKLKGALATDYAGVAGLFVDGPDGLGLAARLAKAVKMFQDPEHGAVRSRLRGLDQSIRRQDQAIARQTERLAEREARVSRQLAALETRMASLNAQGSFMQARFAAPEKTQ